MLVWKRKYRFLIRGISLMLAFSFLPPAGMREMPSLYATAPAAINPVSVKDLESALSPFVSISDLFIPAGKNASIETLLMDPVQKMVFYLEDAHGNLSAQRNMMQALQTLSIRAGLKEPWIALEGSGMGEIDHRVLSAFPHQPTRERLTEYLSLQGKLNAADGFVALYNPKARLFGVDSKNLAEENRQSYRDFLSGKEEAAVLLQKLERMNVFLKGKIYEGNLAWLDKASARFEKDPDYFFTYLNLLQEETKKNKIPFDHYPHLSELLELKKIESRNQTGEVAREIELLKQKKGISDFNDEAALQLWNRDKNVFEDFPHLKNHVQMLERYHTLKVTSLWEELDRWTEALWEKLLFYPEAREAHAIDRTLRFYKKLFAFSLVPVEYSRYLKDQKAYSLAGLEAKIRQFHFLLKPEGLDFKNPDQQRLEQLMQAPLHFYASARKRNGPLLDHLIKLTDQSPQGKVFFIAGGFHRNEIIQDLKAKGLPYAVLTPKISSEEGQENYWKLLGGEQPELESALAGLSTVALEDTLTHPQDRRAIMLLYRVLSNSASGNAAKWMRDYARALSVKDRSELNLLSVEFQGGGTSRASFQTGEGIRRFLITPPSEGSESFSIAEEEPLLLQRSEVRATETFSIETSAVGLGGEANDTAKVRAFLGRLAQSILEKTEENSPGLLDQEKLERFFEKLFVLPNEENKPGGDTADFVRPDAAKSALTAADFVRQLGDRKVRIVFGEIPQWVTFEEKPPSSGRESELVLHMDWPAFLRLGNKKMKIAEMFLSYQLYAEVFDRLVHPKDSAVKRLPRDMEMAQSVFAEEEAPEEGKAKSFLTPLTMFLGILIEGASAQPSGFWENLYSKLIKSALLVDGKYLLVRELGSGGFSTVYKAFDTSMGKYKSVAVKKINKIDPDSPNVRRLEREIDAMVQMAEKDSRYFPKLIKTIPETQVGSQSKFVPPEYLVMEYVRGRPLNEWLPKPGQALDDKKHLSGKEMMEVAIQVLQGLQDLHVKNKDGFGGFVHRDIKPNNIMVHREDDGKLSVKIIDLGLAKELQDYLRAEDKAEEGDDIYRAGHDKTSQNVLIGTPLYMSPEQAMSFRFLSEASDVYSAGLTLIEMLTGTVMMNPLGDKGPSIRGVELFDRHLDPNFHNLSRFKGELDDDLLRILEKMIGLTYENQPEEETRIVLNEIQKNLKSETAQLHTIRYANAGEPLKALRTYLSGHLNPSFPVLKSLQESTPAVTKDLPGGSTPGRPGDKGTLTPAGRETETVSKPSEPPAKKSWFSAKMMGLVITGLAFAAVIGGILMAPFFDRPPIPGPPVDKPPDPPVKDSPLVKDKDIKKDKDKKEETPPVPKMKTIEVWKGQELRSAGVKMYSGLELSTGANFYVSKDISGEPFFTEFTLRYALFPQSIAVTKESEFKLTVKIYRSHRDGLAEIGFLEPRKEKMDTDTFTGIRFNSKEILQYKQVPVRFGVEPKDAVSAMKTFEANLEKNKFKIPNSQNFADGWLELTFERFPGKEEVLVSVGGKSITSFELAPGTYKMTARVSADGSGPKMPIETMHFRIGPIKLEVPEETKKVSTDSKRSELRSAALIMPYNEETVKSFIAAPKIDRPKVIFVTSSAEELRRSEARYGPVAKMYGMAFVRSNVPPEFLRPGVPEMDNILRRAAAFLRIPSKNLEFLVIGISSSELIKRPAIPKSGKTEFYYMPFERKRFVDELPYRTAFLLILDALRKGELDKFGVAPQGSVILVPESLVNDLQIKLQASRLQASAA